MEHRGPFLDNLAALTEPVRCRILLLLERQELTVGELCSVIQLPQSTVSRHLKTLGEAGWVVSRKDGTSRFYHLVENGEGSPLPELWGIIRREIEESPAAVQDSKRLETTLAARRSTSRAFFASAAGEWDQLRGELFGTRFYAQSLLALLDPGWVVGDLGCGTGQVSALVAPFVKHVVAVDASSEMLSAARSRLRKHKNVEIRKGALEELPIEDDSLDVAAFMLVLHHVSEPVAALSEARRVLRPGGKVLIVDMHPHDREEYKQQMGHVWLGFSEEKMSKYLAAAGFEPGAFHSIAPEADAKGPALFITVAYKGMRGSKRQPRSQKMAELAEETA